MRALYCNGTRKPTCRLKEHLFVGSRLAHSQKLATNFSARMNWEGFCRTCYPKLILPLLKKEMSKEQMKIILKTKNIVRNLSASFRNRSTGHFMPGSNHGGKMISLFLR